VQKKLIFIMLILFVQAAWAQKKLECERYDVDDNAVRKSEMTKFSLTLDAHNKKIYYKKHNGPDWVFYNDMVLDIMWLSKDQDRAVAFYHDTSYEMDETAWHPIYIVDIDFANKRYQIETYGGFADFADLSREKESYTCANK